MDDWDPPFVEAISRRRHVIRFDGAGIGRSDGEAPETLEGMAALVAEVIGRLGFDRVEVTGWSPGGIIARRPPLDFPPARAG